MSILYPDDTPGLGSIVKEFPSNSTKNGSVEIYLGKKNIDEIVIRGNPDYDYKKLEGEHVVKLTGSQEAVNKALKYINPTLISIEPGSKLELSSFKKSTAIYNNF